MKLKYGMLKNLKNLTSKELDLLLFIARFQDEKGNVESIYYKDACRELKMCKQSFYNALSGLERKGIVRYMRTPESDYNIKILNNDFSQGKEDYQKGYIMLNRRVFRSKSFQELKAREKYLLIRLMQETHLCRGMYKIGRKKFCDKYKEELGVSARMIRRYLHSLKEFFTVRLVKGIYRISYIADKFAKRTESTLRQTREHLAAKILRQAGYKRQWRSHVIELADLIQQYEGKASAQGYQISNLLRQVLERIRSEEDGEVFRVKYVHMRIKDFLRED